MDAGGRAPKVGALGDAGAIAENSNVTDFQHSALTCPVKTVDCSLKRQSDYTSLLGDHSECEPPDPIPNSEVKPFSADDSVAVCHAKVGNCQALNTKPKSKHLGFFLTAICVKSFAD